MNTIHNNGENDKSLNDDLEKLGRTYRNLEQNEPPELLDQAILNSAHRAIEKKSGWQQFGWMHGLATTAVFVLAFTIILDQRELAPEFEDEVLRNSPLRLEEQSETKKQTSDKTDTSNVETEARDDSRQNAMMKAAPAPASASMEQAKEEQNEPSPERAQPVLRAQSSASEKVEYADKDNLSSNNLQEETMIDEADVMVASPPIDAAIMQDVPAVASESVGSALKARARNVATIEQEIQAIIELKKAGDETWPTKLQAFVERNPDYPLPDELKH